MKDKIIIIYSLFPDQETAERVSDELLAQRLVACVNIIPAIISKYWWNDKIETAPEVAVLFKTTASHFKRCELALLQRHPYQTPCILQIEAPQVSEPYLQWLLKMVDEGANEGPQKKSTSESTESSSS